MSAISGAPTSIIGVASSAPFSPTSANAAAPTATSTDGLGNIFTQTSSMQVGGATSSSSSVGIVQSNDGGAVECEFFGVGVAMAAGLLLM
ncbi:hypothetical protein E6O75_ATG05400 [Venturia nashicola]|uniref:Uncharacterized protein n=1 Tax=Venturia nashicola TaxID=86259 RepID=A0A4Z1P7J8_9PEZI|nr:hypothetical protein E6O75_ATG05400 [Venturia nashicola]